MKNKIVHLLLFCLFAALLPAQTPLRLSFGLNGRQQLQVDDFTEVVDLKLLPGDSLLMLAYCGHADSIFFDMNVALIKLDPDGFPVNSFGQNGVVLFDFDGMDYSTAREICITAQSEIVVLGSGHANNNTDYSPVCIAKFDGSGNPDSSFGINGTEKISFYGGLEFAGGLRTDMNNKLYLAGASYDSIGNHYVPVAGRFSSSAVADSAFGVTGKIVIDFTLGLQALRLLPATAPLHLTGGEAYSLLPLPGGDVLVGGSYGPNCFITRLNENGTLDSAFYGTGFLVFQIDAVYNNRIEKLTALPDGTVLLGVAVDKLIDRDYHVVRIAPANGFILDADFIDFNSGNDWIHGIAVGNAGELICAGRSVDASHSQISGYRSDWFVLDIFHDYTQLAQQQKIKIAFDSAFQSGAAAVVVQSDGTIVCAGFTNTATSGRTDAALIAVDYAAYTTGVETAAATQNRLTVFPNPVTDWVNIQLPDETLFIELTDINGRDVLHEITAGKKLLRLNMSNISAGIYLLHTYGEKNSFAKKIIKTD